MADARSTGVNNPDRLDKSYWVQRVGEVMFICSICLRRIRIPLNTLVAVVWVWENKAIPKKHKQFPSFVVHTNVLGRFYPKISDLYWTISVYLVESLNQNNFASAWNLQLCHSMIHNFVYFFIFNGSLNFFNENVLLFSISALHVTFHNICMSFIQLSLHLQQSSEYWSVKVKELSSQLDDSRLESSLKSWSM